LAESKLSGAADDVGMMATPDAERERVELRK
jgi:hypothetical protein